MVNYHTRIVSLVLIVAGSSLMIEHLFTWGGFDLLDFWGHEYLGVGMIIASLIISTKWNQINEIDLKDPRTWIR